jgi:hypothetical protein
MPHFEFRNDARRGGRLSLVERLKQRQLRLPDAVALAAFGLVVVCIALLGAASSAVAQGEGGPRRLQEGGGSGPAARGGPRPVASPALADADLTRAETPSTRLPDLTRSTSDDEVRSSSSPSERPPAQGRVPEGSGSPGPPARDQAPRGSRGPPPVSQPVRGSRGLPDGASKGPAGGGRNGAPEGAPRGSPNRPQAGATNGAPDRSPHGPVPRRAPSEDSRLPVPRTMGQLAGRPRAPAGTSAPDPVVKPPAARRALSAPAQSRSRPATPAAESISPGAAPRPPDNSDQTVSDIPAASEGSPPERWTGAEPPTVAAPSQPIAPTLPVNGKEQHQGSMLARDEPAKAVQFGRIHVRSEIAPALDAARARLAAPSAVGARASHLTAPSSYVAPQQPVVRAPVSSGGASAGSASSSGVGPHGLVSALLLVVLMHWSALLVVKVRWRPTVFLAVDERPG